VPKPCQFILSVLILIAGFPASIHIHAYAAEPVLEPVKLRLVWKNQFQFAGYYIAKQKGYYAEQGLDVEILEYDPDYNNMQEVLGGDADFVVGRSSILIDRAEGSDIVALFAAFQSSPFMLLTRAFTGIDKPADLKHHRVMITNDARRSGELLAMLANAGLNSDDFVRQKHSFNIDDLINDNTDAIASYVSNEPYQLIQQGIPYNILHPADYGFKMYSDILYTSGTLLRQQPQVVEKFYQASISGWKYAFANIPETVSLIFEKYNTQNRPREALLYEALELKKLAFDSAGNFGTLLPERLQSMAQVYLLTGVIDKEPELQGFIYRPPGDQLNLSYDELEYIKNKQVLNICVQKNWPPYEQMDGTHYHGIIADFMKLIRDKTGLSLHFNPTDTRQQAMTLALQGICDVTAASLQAGQDIDGFLTSNSILNITHALLTLDDNQSFQEITRRVAIAEQQFCEHCFNNKVPVQNLISVDSIETGIKFLKTKQADSLFAAEANLRYNLSMLDIHDMHISNDFTFDSQYGLGMNQQHQVLLGIINKTIRLITYQERDRIHNQNVIVALENGYRESTFWIVIGLIIFVAMLFIYRFHRESLRNRIFKEISETDQLTGIANRRKIIGDINTFIDVSKRYHNELSLIYFDIDDFKLINDRLGHEIGDEVLIDLSAVIKKNIRKTDLFGRIGGEEFIILSPESGISDCEKLVAGLQNKIRAHNFKHAQAVTCSFGITEYKADESCDNFINRADQAMYQAKHNGKDTMVSIG